MDPASHGNEAADGHLLALLAQDLGNGVHQLNGPEAAPIGIQ